jgi:hypothetical protein
VQPNSTRNACAVPNNVKLNTRGFWPSSNRKRCKIGWQRVPHVDYQNGSAYLECFLKGRRVLLKRGCPTVEIDQQEVRSFFEVNDCTHAHAL